MRPNQELEDEESDIQIKEEDAGDDGESVIAIKEEDAGDDEEFEGYENLDVPYEELKPGRADSDSAHEDSDSEEAEGQPSRKGSTKARGVSRAGGNKKVTSNDEPTDGDGSEEESEVYNNPKCPELAIPAYCSLSKEITKLGWHMNAMIKRRDEITNDESGLFDQNIDQTILIELTNSISEYSNDLKVLQNAKRVLSRYL